MKKIVCVALSLILMVSAFSLTNSTVGASQTSNIRKTLKYYKKGEYKRAKKYNKKLPVYAKEGCVKNISKKTKRAYNKKFKKIGKKAYCYYLTDVNNDNKADMLVLCGPRAAYFEIRLYMYEKGRVKYKCKSWAGHCSFCAYPNHNGFIRYFGMRNSESIYWVQYKNGKFVETLIGQRNTDSFIDLGCSLKVQKSRY